MSYAEYIVAVVNNKDGIAGQFSKEIPKWDGMSEDDAVADMNNWFDSKGYVVEKGDLQLIYQNLAAYQQAAAQCSGY